MDKVILPVIEALIGKYGEFAQWFAVLAMFVGSARLFLKPLMGIIKQVVGETKTKKDDELLVKIESNAFYKTLVYLADFILSVKVKTVAKAVTPSEVK